MAYNKDDAEDIFAWEPVDGPNNFNRTSIGLNWDINALPSSSTIATFGQTGRPEYPSSAYGASVPEFSFTPAQREYPAPLYGTSSWQEQSQTKPGLYSPGQSMSGRANSDNTEFDFVPWNTSSMAAFSPYEQPSNSFLSGDVANLSPLGSTRSEFTSFGSPTSDVYSFYAVSDSGAGYVKVKTPFTRSSSTAKGNRARHLTPGDGDTSSVSARVSKTSGHHRSISESDEPLSAAERRRVLNRDYQRKCQRKRRAHTEKLETLVQELGSQLQEKDQQISQLQARLSTASSGVTQSELVGDCSHAHAPRYDSDAKPSDLGVPPF